MKQKRSKTSTRLLFLLLCAIMIIGAVPAYAADSTDPADSIVGYDFSSVDALDAYSQYEKKTSTGESDVLSAGTEYVLAAKHNQVDTITPLPINFYRYGSFLRNTDERQHFMFYNLPYSGDGTIPQNVLTIYADPGVEFEVQDLHNETPIATDSSHNSNEVVHYKKTVIDGHNVYFIQFVPDQTGESTHVVTFFTTSTTTQPHYSFWYGCPLVEEKTVNSSTFAISVRKSNTSSASVSVAATGSIPSERAWVDTVTVQRVSESGASNISRATLRVTMPGDTSPAVGKIISTSMEFLDYPSIVSASPARGTYKFQLTDVKWNALAATGATYMFQGRMVITYLDAFGD